MNALDLVHKSENGEALSREELIYLLGRPPDSPEGLVTMAEANRLSKESSDRKAEVHAQLALNLAPCPCNCAFCSFALSNGVFTEETKLSTEEAVRYARQFQEEGANAVFLMSTAGYPFSRFIEVSQEIRRNLPSGTTLVANVGDASPENAARLKDAGFAGVYHALRLREGADTGLSPETRRQSIRAFQEAGLKVGTCVEPVGPEHGNDELAEMILYTASLRPAYSGAARRISIPGTPIARRGMINELRMAQIVAVTRLGMPPGVSGNCTHEPCTLGGLAGANLFWAEAGANPRDIHEKTEDNRGGTVTACRTLFRESGWDVLEGPSRFYDSRP